MANGRSIKRKLAKSQMEQSAPQGAPMEQGGPMGQEGPVGLGDMTPEEFMMEAQEGASYGGRSEHLAMMLDPQQMQDLPEEDLKQMETIGAALTELVHSPDTKKYVQDTLQSGDPGYTVPYATNMIMDRFESLMEKSGPMPLEMKLTTGMQAFREVLDVAQAMGVAPKELSEAQQEQLLRGSMQMYIQKGLKEKTIDPIELQTKVEQLMTPEEQLVARGMAKNNNMPYEPTQQQNVALAQQNAIRPLEAENANLKKQNQQMEKALQGIASQPQGGM